MIVFKRHFLFLFVLLSISQYFFGQKKEADNSEALLGKNYDYLKSQIALSEKDTVKLKAYLAFFKHKANTESNWEELYHYYRYFHYYYPENKHLVYADSAIFYAKKLKDNALIGDAYYSKGVVYNFRKQYREALDNNLIANGYIQKTNDNYLKHKIKYSIANIKLYLGFYDEAIALFQECIAYFCQNEDHNNQRGCLKSLNGLAQCYTSLGQYDLSAKTIAVGIKIATEQNLDFEVKYFYKTQGINEYFKKNYKLAIQKLDEALPILLENEDIPALTTLYFYKGKSLLRLQEQENAMDCFLKVDRNLADAAFITPELRENYEILIDYYKQQNHFGKQLFYVNKLINTDKVLNHNYKYLSSKIHKEYDAKSLLQAKISLEAQLLEEESKSWIYISIAAFFAISLGTFIIFYYKKQRVYKERFEALMQQAKRKEIDKKVRIDEKVLGINKEVVDDLLQKLEKFETNQLFLKKGLTLSKFSDQLKTNSSYLSKVINHYKGKNFTNYINELRIEYVIDLLKTERVTQKYTIKALSEMTGFATTQHFSDAFYLKTGLRPSFFIHELGKSQLRVVS